ncbi:hypothetical protein [Thermoproteus tenax]|uniref:hypothetical protein n=1 Tax=Thermoproteus tenax TaxID=2271 RepID=UPI001432E0E5|nr:hypothetical protein [Thermoproteus tenax]
MEDGHCQHAVYQYHELYAALCQCQRDDLFLIAKHDCTYRHAECQIDYREGATTGGCIATIDDRCLCFALTQCP